ncbi:MAG: ParB N-terminal domain-containing protein [Deltaproteobacteria bacterium]|nr:ParB N-terminal domain-containing protein [Deltaproteobacteria bacterium]
MKAGEIRGVETPLLIRTALIDETPGPFCMSFGFSIDALKDSIKKTGLINPLIITKNSNNKYIIVAGYRRLMAIKHLRIQDSYCIDVSESGRSPRDLLLLNFYDNLSTRVFNDVEKGMILNRLSAHFSQDELKKDFMPLLKIGNSNDLDLFLKIGTLDNHIKYALTNGAVSLKTLRLLLTLDEESREALCSLIESIKINSKYQYYLTEYLIDISQIEKKSIRDILGEEQHGAILNDKKANNPQKSKKLLRLIWSRRYPNLSNSIKQFKKGIARLNLPGKIKIDFLSYFEAPDYRLEILFRDGEELVEDIEFLLGMKEKIRVIKDPW